MNKLNAARRHANDCPEDIFSGKSAGTRRGGIPKDRPMVCRSTDGCGRWVIRLDSAALHRQVSSGFVRTAGERGAVIEEGAAGATMSARSAEERDMWLAG
ncbi:hypothetical protein [Burkholderia cepacia]|uniref:hypothetical protein n=1 Tax=Burkholderia cepacia TaxID=292 RepID=UPI002AB6D718|nr:hypothetical protein [Burkholderia cepacia]